MSLFRSPLKLWQCGTSVRGATWFLFFAGLLCNAKSIYRRITPWDPSSADLKTYAGRFENDEIGTVFRVGPGKNDLVIALDHAPRSNLRFAPLERDAFQFRRMTIRFTRDQTGNVAGIELRNPLLRCMKFTRTGSAAASNKDNTETPGVSGNPVKGVAVVTGGDPA